MQKTPGELGISKQVDALRGLVGTLFLDGMTSAALLMTLVLAELGNPLSGP